MQFKDLFQGYSKSHGTYLLHGATDERGKQKGAAQTAKGPITDGEWKNHLGGKTRGLGVVPLLDDNESVHFGAIDIDKYPIDYDLLEKDTANLPLVITKSKSGGAHLWLFLERPTNAKLVIKKLHEWAAALGHGTAEVFPKQWKRNTDHDVGNWINLPYYGPTRVCYFEGREVSLTKFLEIAESRRISEAMLRRIILTDDTEDRMFGDGPPCLQMLHERGIPVNRNTALCNFGIYFRKKNPDYWAEDLKRYNTEVLGVNAVDQMEMGKILNSVNRTNYKYYCNEEPLKACCNRSVCLKRPLGISDGKNDDGPEVEMTGLTKLKTDPPRYWLNVEGVRIELEGVEELQSQTLFGRRAMAQADAMPRPCKEPVWRGIIKDLLAHMEEIEAMPEATPKGQYLAFLNDFIERRAVDERDGIAQGNVWVDGEFAYIRLQEFDLWLRRQGYRDVSNAKGFGILQQIGGKPQRFNIKGKCISTYAIPIKSLAEGLQSEPYDPIKFKDAFGDANDEPAKE